MSNDYTNPNTNPKTLTTLTLTLTDSYSALESFCVPVFCDFVRNYSCTIDGVIDTPLHNRHKIVEQLPACVLGLMLHSEPSPVDKWVLLAKIDNSCRQ